MKRSDALAPCRQRGLTIVELMAALLIASILLAGLVTIFASMRRSFSTTRELNQLVNQQQFTSTVLTNAIDGAGYYPMTSRTVRGLFPNIAQAFPVMSTTAGSSTSGSYAVNFTTAGQFIYGTGGTVPGSKNDMVAVRIITGGSGTKAYDCLGESTVPAGAPGSVGRAISVFWVNPAKNELMCATRNEPAGEPLVGDDVLTGKSTGLLGGVSSLVAEYGVDTNRDGSVNRFMSADTLNSAAGQICPDVVTGAGNSSSCWPYVRSVRFTLGFISALNDAKSPIYMTRTVHLNNTDGRTLNSMDSVIASN